MGSWDKSSLLCASLSGGAGLLELWQLRITKTRGPGISFMADGSAFLQGNKQVSFSPLHPFCFSFPVLVTLLSFTLVSSARCLQQWQLLQCESTTSCGCLAAGEWSSVITTACLLKGWARLAPSPFLPLACLPMHCLTFPSTTRSADGEGTSPSLLRRASRQSSRCSQICMHLRRSWPSGPYRDGAYPKPRGFDELVPFLQSIWRFTLHTGTPDLLRSVPWQAFCCGFLIYRENLFPLVTVEGNSLPFALSVSFCEGLDAQETWWAGTLSFWFVLFSSSFEHEPV